MTTCFSQPFSGDILAGGRDDECLPRRPRPFKTWRRREGEQGRVNEDSTLGFCTEKVSRIGSDCGWWVRGVCCVCASLPLCVWFGWLQVVSPPPRCQVTPEHFTCRGHEVEFHCSSQRKSSVVTRRSMPVEWPGWFVSLHYNEHHWLKILRYLPDSNITFMIELFSLENMATVWNLQHGPQPRWRNCSPPLYFFHSQQTFTQEL